MPQAFLDHSRVEYLAELVGTEHVRNDLSPSAWPGRPQPADVRMSATALPLLTPSVLRQMHVGDALLLHGELPAAWIRSSGHPLR